jgi:hypothetical protein
MAMAQFFRMLKLRRTDHRGFRTAAFFPRIELFFYKKIKINGLFQKIARPSFFLEKTKKGRNHAAAAFNLITLKTFS